MSTLLVPPPSVQQPCFPIHSIIHRFDVTAGSSNGVVLQRIGHPPLLSSSSSSSTINTNTININTMNSNSNNNSTLQLVLFPCKYGDPTKPIGWPLLSLHECSVLVNESYVTAALPRCPTRSGSHRTLAGFLLTPYLNKHTTGEVVGVDANTRLKLVITSHATWTATFLLAWCSVIDIPMLIEQTVTNLLHQNVNINNVKDTTSVNKDSTINNTNIDSNSNSSEDRSMDGSESDIDVDSGWVDDDNNNGDDTIVNNNNKQKENTTTTSSLLLRGGVLEDDNALDDTEAIITLRCPLSYQRIRIAGKGKNCTHLACFDIYTYLESALRSSAWNCPICDEPVYLDDIRLDHTVQSALDSLNKAKEEKKNHNENTFKHDKEENNEDNESDHNNNDSDSDDDDDKVVLFGPGNREWRRLPKQRKYSSRGEEEITGYDGNSTVGGDKQKQLMRKEVVDVDISDSDDNNNNNNNMDERELVESSTVMNGRKRTRSESV